ncbi:MAG: hypothetical protein SFU98_21640 [Leptospiraceae bacterium]|nr:hypothetical protein [Leptospiraceae bacterium]
MLDFILSKLPEEVVRVLISYLWNKKKREYVKKYFPLNSQTIDVTEKKIDIYFGNTQTLELSFNFRNLSGSEIELKFIECEVYSDEKFLFHITKHFNSSQPTKKDAMTILLKDFLPEEKYKIIKNANCKFNIQMNIEILDYFKEKNSFSKNFQISGIDRSDKI